MIALLGMLAVLLGGDPAEGAQGKPLSPDPDRPVISSSEIKALRENNIFAPRSVTLHGPRTPKSSTPTHSEPVYSKPKPPVVTGIFLDPKSNTYELIVEDRNESSLKQFKEPKLLKDGDEWSGLKVESIVRDHAVCKYAGTSRNLRVGESLPEGEWKPSAAPAGEEEFPEDGAAPAPSKTSDSPSRKAEVAPQSSDERNRVLEEMKKRNGKKNRPQEPEE